MKDELNNPRICYMPCSPAEFIKQRLVDQQLYQEAQWFWQQFCSRKFNVERLDALYQPIRQLDRDEIMPAWGTYGT